MPFPRGTLILTCPFWRRIPRLSNLLRRPLLRTRQLRLRRRRVRSQNPNPPVLEKPQEAAPDRR